MSFAFSPSALRSLRLVCRDLVVHNALFTGDLEAVKRLFPKGAPVNLVVESRGGDMRWICRNQGKE
ncbi:hypothetical protein Z043_107938 [Scleropages formosus]|uniref:Uncharacterized protein n=1 Tax=Scleropages formosus TaxID=113540 RepID=A0A0N8K0T2_SCLFO|nr:hypothetical protein Z043_107938 [Scleropages formosus]